MRRLARNLALVLVAATVAGGLQAQPMPLGGEFQVNTYTPSLQEYPAVAVKSDGDFVVVWGSYGSDGTDSDSWSIQGQRYASDGSGLGGQFTINTYTASSQQSPWLAEEPDGDFVVVWHSNGSGGTDTDYPSVQGQRFASDGSVLGVQFQVNTYTTSFQWFPAVAVETSGDFVVVWNSYGSGGTDSWYGSVQGQRYASDGSVLGGEFQVNTYTTSFQQSPAVAVETGGDFVVVWHSDGSRGTDTDSNSVQGQRFASNGLALGGEFQVNSYTSGSQVFPAVAIGSGGDFVVVWHSNGSGGTDTDYTSVQGQRFASDGSVLGVQFQVNTFTTSNQKAPAVAATPGGNIVVVWNSDGSGGTDSDSWSVQGQRYEVPFFADGFESGDTSAW